MTTPFAATPLNPAHVLQALTTLGSDHVMIGYNATGHVAIRPSAEVDVFATDSITTLYSVYLIDELSSSPLLINLVKGITTPESAASMRLAVGTLQGAKVGDEAFVLIKHQLSSMKGFPDSIKQKGIVKAVHQDMVAMQLIN